MTTYTYQEALEASLNYFNNDDLAAQVFVDKYALRNRQGEWLESTPRDMHWRIASELARIEKGKFKKPLTKEEIFPYLNHFDRIVPQGSPMFGIGNPYQYVSLANCFLVEPPEDSYGGILKTDEQLVQICKRRGGVGVDISKLRPIDTPTSNAAGSSTGIIPFMTRYSNSIREVGQQGRRGALLISLSVHHPEILSFITAKKDLTKITGANLSVKLTDEFLTAVQKNTTYQQRWPVDSDDPTFSQDVNAKDIWNAIIDNVHLMSEPGLLFWDTIIRQTPSDCYPQYKSEGTNPCQPGWAKVVTPLGIRPLSAITCGDKIWSTEGWTFVLGKRSRGNKKVYRYGTTAGCFYGTENHKVLDNGQVKPVKDANCLDIIANQTELSIDIHPQDIMDGLVLGDGSKHKASNNKMYLCIGQKDHDYFTDEINSLIGNQRSAFGDFAYEITTTIKPEELDYTYNRSVPKRYLHGKFDKVCGFLRGLFSANGGICGNRITLKSSSFQIIEDVQMMLSAIGIKSYYTTNKSKKVKFANGEYQCKQSYDINISIDRNKFFKYIGFIQHYKTDRLRKIIDTVGPSSKPDKNTYDIVSVDYVSEEEVFDITVDNSSHTYWTQGCNVKNCGEVILNPKNACRLLLLNLFTYVQNPFQKNAYFDFDLFHHDCKIAQRFQDDIIDLEIESINRIIAKLRKDPEDKSVKDREIALWKDIRTQTENSRRTGTGITALGDALAALGMAYGNKKSIETTGQIYKTLKLACYESSVDMAEELGSFEGWDYELEKNHPFLLQIKEDDPKLYARMKKHGRRHIALLTTAPAGSVSILCQTTSGIEPVYQLQYKRRKKHTSNTQNTQNTQNNQDGKDFGVDFVDDNGDKWMEFDVYHSKIKQWQNTTGKTDLSDSPWVCAIDVDWKNRIKIQAAAQQHNCHSISSTLNLPSDVSKETIDNIYMTAWKMGLKGITVYRQGSRDGVLLEKNKKPVVTKDKGERPRELKCQVHHTTVKGQKYFVLVGLWSDNTPYEVFAGKNGFLSSGIKTGKIIRKRKNFYKAAFDDKHETELSPITAAMSDSEEGFSRMISMSLRSGADMHLVVNQLEKVGGEDMHGFAKCIARALKHYIPDNTSIGEKCPECGGGLVRMGGCPTCLSCSYSKCL